MNIFLMNDFSDGQKDLDTSSKKTHFASLLMDATKVINGLPDGKLELVTQKGKLAVFVFKFAVI